MTRYITVGEYLKKKTWCENRSWTDLYEDHGRWYAFPPGSLIAQEIKWSLWEVLGFLFDRLIFPIFVAAVGVVCLDSALLLALSQSLPNWRDFISFTNLLSTIFALSYWTLSKSSD